MELTELEQHRSNIASAITKFGTKCTEVTACGELINQAREACPEDSCRAIAKVFALRKASLVGRIVTALSPFCSAEEATVIAAKTISVKELAYRENLWDAGTLHVRPHFLPIALEAIEEAVEAAAINPQKRVVCAQFAKVRKCLRLSIEDFANGVGVNPDKLALYEAEQLPWPAGAIAQALPRITELCALAQGDVDEALTSAPQGA